MKKKILIVLLVLLVVGGYAGYSFAMPQKKVKLHINGTIYVLPKPFTLNMNGGQYATLTVALLLAPTQTTGTSDPNNPPPTGFGTLNEEAVVRAIVTNDLTDQPANALITTGGRNKIEQQILHDIKQQTDDSITAVYFTDIAVQ